MSQRRQPSMEILPKTEDETRLVGRYVREFDLLDHPFWGWRSVLKAGKLLDKFTDATERKAIAGMLDQKDGMPPVLVLRALEHLTELPPEKRAAILAQYNSDDPRERENALSMAVGNPPNPDPRIHMFLNFEGQLKTLRKEIAKCLKRYPDDAENKLIEKCDAEAARWQESILPPIFEALRKRSKALAV